MGPATDMRVLALLLVLHLCTLHALELSTMNPPMPPLPSNLENVQQVLNRIVKEAYDRSPFQKSSISNSHPFTLDQLPFPPSNFKGGTRPSAPQSQDPDDRPVENPVITLFRDKLGMAMIPTLLFLLAPLLFSRGLTPPEYPEYFRSYQPYEGAWRDPYPFRLPSTTPTSLVPPL